MEKIAGLVHPDSSETPAHKLEMLGISKGFPGVQALMGVDFELLSGEIHCLMGENGAGKSTLMKIMAGIYPHVEGEGEMRIDGVPVKLTSVRDAWAHGIGMIHQELNLVPELAIYENIYLGRELHTRLGLQDTGTMIRESRRLLDTLGTDIDPRKPIRSLRVGERQLIEIAKALSLNARFLIMDEPTSALSGGEVDHLFAVMRRLHDSGVGIVYISHRMDEVFQIADRITVLRDGAKVITAAAADLDRGRLIQAMVGREVIQSLHQGVENTDAPVLSVRDLSLTRPGVLPLHHISFDAYRGEILGIAGLMGASRTELLETLFGVHPARYLSGTIMFEQKTAHFASPGDAIRSGLGFVSEDRKAKSLVMESTVRFNTTLASLSRFANLLGIVNQRKERQSTRETVEQLNIRTPGIETTVGNLSGGNQQKVVLAKFMLTQPRLLLLDEPTRGIDVGAKAQIYELIQNLATQGTTCLVVSSEMPELLTVCDRILVLCEGQLTGMFRREEATQEAILEAAMKFSQKAS